MLKRPYLPLPLQHFPRQPSVEPLEVVPEWHEPSLERAHDQKLERRLVLRVVEQKQA